MNVALLQIELDVSSAAGNLQRVLAAIERVAKADPPPDLLVLPGACDTGGAAPGREYPVSVIENIREAIAHKAREWGIYIAVGLHTRGPDGYHHSVVLLDPDADAAAVHDLAGGNGGDGFENARWSCTVGDIEVRAVEGGVDAGALREVPSRGLVVAVPLPAGATVKPPATGAHWAIVRSAGPAKGRGKKSSPQTRFVLPNGKEGRSAKSAKEEVVWTSIALRPATSQERADELLAAREID